MDNIIELTCCICDLDDNLIKTTCNHSVHDDCLKQWFKYSKSGPICPMCRTLQPHDSSSDEINIYADYEQYNDLSVFWPIYRPIITNEFIWHILPIADFDGDQMGTDFIDNNQIAYQQTKNFINNQATYQSIVHVVNKSNKYKYQNKQKIFMSKHQQSMVTNSFKKLYR